MQALPIIPPPGETALLLDVDGTLLDMAATPESVVVPADLPGILERLRELCGGALAIITGRPIAQIDALLPGAATAIAGEHGAALRRSPGGPVERPALPALPSNWTAHAAAIAASHPGVRLETKRHGLVLHYRAAPATDAVLAAALADMLAGHEGAFCLVPSKMAWEVRPTAADKGTALRALMGQPPFAGRLPVFVGDDVTDQDAIAAAREAGGIGLFVPESFGEPAHVRAWLTRLAAPDGGWQP